MTGFEKSLSICIGKGLARPFPIQILKLFSNPVILHTELPLKMEQTECSETSAYKIQTPGNYPEESIQHSEHGSVLYQEFIKFFCLYMDCTNNAGVSKMKFVYKRVQNTGTIKCSTCSFHLDISRFLSSSGNTVPLQRWLIITFDKMLKYMRKFLENSPWTTLNLNYGRYPCVKPYCQNESCKLRCKQILTQNVWPHIYDNINDEI